MAYVRSPFHISNDQARRLFLERQGLSVSPRSKLTDQGLLELIKSLGFVQVDSISTVARAHHMILFTRNQTYRPEQLKRLLEHDRTLFEHWTHDAAIVPVQFYPYWRHRFVREEHRLRERWRTSRREGFEAALDRVLKHVLIGGPVRSRDLKTEKKRGDGWWDWHPEKTALEFHWRTGTLAITGREGFQKIYDTSENVIPAAHRSRHVDTPAFLDWACHSALARLGVANPREIAAFWDLVTTGEAADWVARQLEQGELIDVTVACAGDVPPHKAVAFATLPDELLQLPEPPKRVRVLSPFDPLIRDRKRCQRLFGFDYRIEIFVPAAKRQYGYYVFPLLEGQRLIGRIDMKRIDDALTVLGIWLEPGVDMGIGRRKALEAELDRHRRFIGASSVRFADGVWTG